MQYINPADYKKIGCCTRIDVLNLVKTEEQRAEEMQAAQQAQAQQSLVEQAGQMVGSPIMH